MKKHIVVLTGAGMSAESGVSTFRDSGGLWEQYRVEQVATPEGWHEDPKLVTDFYNGLRRQLLTKDPCEGHRLLAELEKSCKVSIITQNVDDLHERAGSSDVLHLHGELFKVTSSQNPNDPHQIRTLKADEWEVKIGDKAPDGSQLRPFIVWFGEAVPNIERAVEICGKADVFLIIGTSLNVYPAAGLIQYVPEGCPVYLIDPAEVTIPAYMPVTHIKKGASEGMKAFLQMLQQ